MNNSIKNIISHSFNEVEKAKEIKILFGAIVSSREMGLSNASSDFDFHFIFTNSELKRIDYVSEINGQTIDLSGWNLNYVVEKINDYSRDNKIIPSYFYKKDNKPYDATHSIIFRILSSNNIWDNNNYIKENKEFLKSIYIKKNAIDYFFTRAIENYNNDLTKEEVKIRKYLYTLHAIFSMRAIINNECLNMNFNSLKRFCEDKKILKLIDNLVDINNNYILQEDDNFLKTKEILKIEQNKELNLYIKKELDEISKIIKESYC